MVLNHTPDPMTTQTFFWLQFNFLIKKIQCEWRIGLVWFEYYVYLHFEIHKEIIRKQRTLPTTPLQKNRYQRQQPNTNDRTVQKKRIWTLFASCQCHCLALHCKYIELNVLLFFIFFLFLFCILLCFILKFNWILHIWA